MSLEALFHCIDNIEMLVEGEGLGDFEHCLNHRRQYSSNSRVAKSFIWSFVTAVRWRVRKDYFRPREQQER